MKYGVIPSENKTYHHIDHKDRLLCTGFSPEELIKVELEKTFGMDLCSECRRRQ